MSHQTRKGSAVESVVNIISGIAINYFLNWAVFPVFGIHVGHETLIGLTAVYTVASFIRSYFIRRWFVARLRRTIQERGGR